MQYRWKLLIASQGCLCILFLYVDRKNLLED